MAGGQKLKLTIFKTPDYLMDQKTHDIYDLERDYAKQW